MSDVRGHAGRKKGRLRFSLGRLLLLPLTFAVFMAFIPESNAPSETAFWYGPLWLLKTTSRGDDLFAILICSGAAVSIWIAVLWPNRYTFQFVAFMLAIWFCVGWAIASSAAC